MKDQQRWIRDNKRTKEMDMINNQVAEEKAKKGGEAHRETDKEAKQVKRAKEKEEDGKRTVQTVPICKWDALNDLNGSVTIRNAWSASYLTRRKQEEERTTGEGMERENVRKGGKSMETKEKEMTECATSQDGSRRKNGAKRERREREWQREREEWRKRRKRW